MNIKKLTSVFLSVLILYSSLGLAFSVHYCHDEIASVSLTVQQDEPCGEIIDSCCVVNDNHNKCCSDKVIKTDKKSDNILVKTFQLELQNFVTFQSLEFNFSKEIISVKKQSLIENYCESNSPPLYKKYCQLIFYA